MGYKFFLAICLLSCIATFCHGLCDQRRFGGKMKCCTGKDSQCFVKVQANRTRGQTNTICYCDEYCKFTNDCCDDIDIIRKYCRRAQDCKVSKWGSWSRCSVQCGIGYKKRTRNIIQYPTEGGKQCPSLRQTRGCNGNGVNCPTNRKYTALVLPIHFRREKFGSYGYENILPAVKENNLPNYITKPTNSYCVHYKVTFKRKNCRNTWAADFRQEIPVCVECQSRVMKGGHCRGEGLVGIRTRWRAFGLKRCHGDWIRLGEIIPNCTCNEKQFTNVVFV